MTSTSTFQGMDTGAKPSSRVLAPPGGGSSNIFGGSEPVQAPQKKESVASTKPVASTTPVEPTPAPVSQSGQGERFVRAAPKQGDDSFQNLFGSEKCLDIVNSSRPRQESQSKPVRLSGANNHSSPSTFDSLFGHADLEIRTKSASRKPTNSFNRLFGDQDEGTQSVSKALEDSCRKLGSLSAKDPQANSKSSDDLDNSFHRVFGEFQGVSSLARSKHLSDCNSAYNPITGQPYDLPEQKKSDSAATKEEEENAVGKENEQKSGIAAKPAVEAKEKTSTRIAQPPGGKSSGLW